jgi:hypothetical protein
MPLKMRFWTEEELAVLREHYERLGPTECSKMIDRSSHACAEKAFKIDLHFYTKGKGRPARSLYENTLRSAADTAGIKMTDALGCSRKRSIVHVRWRAWTELYQTGRYSLTGIGFVGGYDHTTILNGIRRLEAQAA